MRAGLQANKDVERIKREYKKFIGRKITFIIFSILLIAIFAGLAATLGSYQIHPIEVYGIVLNGFMNSILTGFYWNPETTKEMVVWNLRLPRILLAVLAGMGFAIAGAMTQGILRNPLATPYTLGIASGAALGAAIAIILTKGIIFGKYLIVGNAFVFSLIPTFVILGLTRLKKATPETMVLAGIAMMYIFSAVTTVLMYFAESDAVKAAYFWTVGDLGRAQWDAVIVAFVALILISPILIIKAWDVNIIMGAGDDTAKSLGINPEKTRIFIMLLSCLLTATIVSFVGTIGFICLVAPHITRIIIGGDNRYLVPASGFFGGALLLICDTIARTIIAPIVLPVGVVTAFLGGPMFLYILLRKKKDYW